MNIELILSPAGNLRIEPVDTGTDNEIWDAPENTVKSLTENFSKGNGPGLLTLVREELPSGIPASFRYFRKLAREFVTRLCHASGTEKPRSDRAV